jgi:hypothetical protein
MHDEEPHNLYSSPSINKTTKSRRMIWTERVHGWESVVVLHFGGQGCLHLQDRNVNQYVTTKKETKSRAILLVAWLTL